MSRKTTLIADLKQFCGLVVSNPLYFSYFVFFSPYLIKILSFLFPLVFTTSLLLIAFLTISPCLIAHHDVTKATDLEDFEAYKIVFEDPIPILGVQENQPQFSEQSSVQNSEDLIGEKKMEAQGANADKVVQNQNQKERNNGSEEAKVNVNKATKTAITGNDWQSMRKEKEWKRTLACKLYEERNDIDGSGEGMDLLWETYEMDAIKSKAKREELSKKKKKKIKTKKRWENSDDEDEEGEASVQLCCLQALKLSAGKVNLGMRKPNIINISKAIKGFGWLHHVSKKVHIDDRF